MTVRQSRSTLHCTSFKLASFWVFFPMHQALKLCRLVLELHQFTQSKPNNLVRHPKPSFSKSKLERKKKEATKFSKNTQKHPSKFSPEIQRMSPQIFCHHVCGISLVDSFQPLSPQNSISSLIPHNLFRPRVCKILGIVVNSVVIVSIV